MEGLKIKTEKREQFIDITAKVEEIIQKAGLTNGVIEIFVPHTTAGITINEKADPSVVADMTDILERLVPWNNNYRHLEGNSAAHMKSTLLGNSVRVYVREGRLLLGTWQAIFFCEFDGPRQRNVWIRVEVDKDV